MTDFWQDLVLTAIRNTATTLKTVVPSLLAMAVLLMVGAVAGWVVAALVRRLARAVDLDRRSASWGVSAALRRAGVNRLPSEALRLLAFWGIFVIFATMGVDALAIPGAPGATVILLHLLPRLLSALLILLVGALFANFVGQAALIAAVNAGLPEARFLARAARWAVLADPSGRAHPSPPGLVRPSCRGSSASARRVLRGHAVASRRRIRARRAPRPEFGISLAGGLG